MRRTILLLFIAASAFAAEPKQQLIQNILLAPGEPALTRILGGGAGLPPDQISDSVRLELYEQTLSEDDARNLLHFLDSAAGKHYLAVAPKFAADARTALEASTVHYIEETKQRNLEHQTRNEFRGLGLALAAYFTDHKSYPDAAAQLVPQYAAKVPDQDAWGMPIRYRVTEDTRHYTLTSAGRDGKFASRSHLQKSDDIVFTDGKFTHNDDPISSGAPEEEEKKGSRKTGLIRELLRITDAQDTTADAVIDILGIRLGLGIAPEETRGEAREGPQMAQITEETQIPLYRRYFTEAQLRPIVAFFKTESGDHYVQLARKIAAEGRKNLRMKSAPHS